MAVVVVLLGFALRLYRLERLPLSWDEGTSIYLAGLPFHQLAWAKDFTIDANPPTYEEAFGLWTGSAVTSVFSARFLSVAIGVIGVALAAALARRSFGALAGAVAAAFVAENPMHVHFSQEVRMYLLVAAHAGLTLALAVGILRGEFDGGLGAGGESHGRWWE